MFWGRNKSKLKYIVTLVEIKYTSYKTLEAQEMTAVFILINLQDNSKMS